MGMKTDSSPMDLNRVPYVPSIHMPLYIYEDPHQTMVIASKHHKHFAILSHNQNDLQFIIFSIVEKIALEFDQDKESKDNIQKMKNRRNNIFLNEIFLSKLSQQNNKNT